MRNSKNAAVFLDRDGTIIEDRGFLSDVSDIVFFPQTIEALRRLQKYFLLFIVTNQPGIARGIITFEDVYNVNAAIVKKLAGSGIKITEIYVCPHDRSDNCQCIKPNPYFIQKAAEVYNIDATSSFTIGDHPHDIQFGKNVNAQGIYVLTGHGQNHITELPPGTNITTGIMEAVEKILHLILK